MGQLVQPPEGRDFGHVLQGESVGPVIQEEGHEPVLDGFPALEVGLGRGRGAKVHTASWTASCSSSAGSRMSTTPPSPMMDAPLMPGRLAR